MLPEEVDIWGGSLNIHEVRCSILNIDDKCIMEITRCIW